MGYSWLVSALKHHALFLKHDNSSSGRNGGVLDEAELNPCLERNTSQLTGNEEYRNSVVFEIRLLRHLLCLKSRTVLVRAH